MDPRTEQRLREAGIDLQTVTDPRQAWLTLHEHFGLRATAIDWYELEAHVRGVGVEDLSEDEMDGIAREVLRLRDPGHELVGAERGDPVEVVPYDPAWVDRFEKWKRRLESALGPTALSVDHIGSTSVPGLAAKPIVDIQVTVPDVEDEASYVPQVEGVGVDLRAREPDHRYFRPAPGRPREVQIHVCHPHSDWGSHHILFRDYLRENPEAAQAYADLKIQLATRYHGVRIAYNEAKTGFILDVLDRADQNE